MDGRLLGLSCEKNDEVMTKKKIIFVLLVLLTLPIYRINSLFAKNVTPTVKIGVLLPLTGPLREEAKIISMGTVLL